MRHRHAQRLCLGAVLAASLACGPAGDVEPTSPPAELRPVETFRWGAQPIAFALPPEGWRREIANQGGMLGVRFVKSGSVGEVIEIAEYMALDERDRCKQFREVLDSFDDLDPRGFARAIQHARLYASPPINSLEELVAKQANDTLDRARGAFMRADRAEARLQFEIAARQAGRLYYDIGDVIDRVLFAPKNLPPYIKIEVTRPDRGEFNGKPAFRQNYTLEDSGRLYAGRQLYFMHQNHLFVAGYQGLEQNVPLFDRVLETVAFPERDCRF